MATNLKTLMKRLHEVPRSALQSAAGICLSRSNYEVELEHWLLKLIEASNSDFVLVCKHFGVNPQLFSRDLEHAIDLFRTGNSRNPTLSPNLVALVEEAWLVASLEFGVETVRSGHLAVALMKNDGLRRQITESSRRFARISLETLISDFYRIVVGSAEQLRPLSESQLAGEQETPSERSADSALEKYTIDLTGQARAGKIDPIVGRDSEIRQMIDILMRRRQNNPILTGEAGVGKTAVVEGLACRIEAGDVPPPLKNVELRVLDLGLLQAGAGVKGEFENRLKSVIEEVKGAPHPIILFVDEAHTLIGAGGAAGQGDAANLLKPALSRGELRTIGATTWAEYKKHIENDPALTRRFQVVKVDEPTEETCVRMMQGVAERLEAHHQVEVSSEAIAAAVHLSARYLTERRLPDKSVSVLDTACARVAVSQCATPPPIEDCARRLASIEVERKRLLREQATGKDHGPRIEVLDKEEAELRQELTTLEARLKEERALIGEIRTLRAKLGEPLPDATISQKDVRDEAEGKDEESEEEELTASGEEESTGAELEAEITDDADTGAEQPETDLRSALSALESCLQALQGETPLVYLGVTSEVVGEVISAWTNIPLGRMMKDELEAVQTLERTLSRRILGQDHALRSISGKIQVARAGLEDPNKPVGVFLLIGPSGVGKTETALALAEALYGGERNLITINMSEYQQEHAVTGLRGSPPSFVGYKEGGVLTEPVRRNPYSVVLLDEIEKAHSEVMKLFLHVFDQGSMKDGEGQEINFKNTVIILTSNLGSKAIMDSCQDDSRIPDPELLKVAIKRELQTRLSPEFLGRLTVIPYHPLPDQVLQDIVRLKLDRLAVRMKERQGVALLYADKVVTEIAARCMEVDTGARNINHILDQTLLPELSQEILTHLAEQRPLRAIEVDIGDTGSFTYTVDTTAE